MTEVKLPDSIKNIEYSTFSKSTSLRSVTIPAGVTSIEELAFFNCSGLTSVKIPASVMDIGLSAFSQTPWFENQRKKDPMIVVNNILIDGQAYAGDVVIPEGVTKISYYDFEKNNSLTSVTIPESVVSVGSWEFASCSDLKRITFMNPECELFDY